MVTHFILSLGASHLALVRLSGGVGGPVLKEVGFQEMPGDPEQKDHWLEFVDQALSQLGFKARLEEVDALVLPGWAVWTKLLRVSRIEGAGQRDVVKFEADNAMPNGLAGHEWTYSVLQDDGFERDVLVQAIATDFLEALLDRLLARGIRPQVIDGLISAQWTALQSQVEMNAVPVVLLDVGSRSVSLLVAAPGELPFIRNFNFGGSQVTQALAGQLGKSFSEAEKQKMECVSTQAHTQQLEWLNQASEGFVTRLVNEVQRSLALFRRQGQGKQPARILLTGGASRLPGLADFLQRKTGVPTEFYDAFGGIVSGPALSTSVASQAGYALSEPLGLGLRMLNPPEPAPNLLPAAWSTERTLSLRNPWILSAAALLVLTLLLAGLKFHWQAREFRQAAVSLDASLAPLQTLSGDINRAHEEYLRLTGLAEAKADLLLRRNDWVNFLADLQKRLHQVQDVWLESIAPEEGVAGSGAARLRVTGSLLDRENPLSIVSGNSRRRVEALLGSIEESPFIQSVDNRRFDTSRPGILQFDFSLAINPGTSL